jgi:hypothetical protein
MKPHLAITEDNLAAMEVFAECNEEPIVKVNLMHVRPQHTPREGFSGCDVGRYANAMMAALGKDRTGEQLTL